MAHDPTDRDALLRAGAQELRTLQLLAIPWAHIAPRAGVPGGHPAPRGAAKSIPQPASDPAPDPAPAPGVEPITRPISHRAAPAKSTKTSQAPPAPNPPASAPAPTANAVGSTPIPAGAGTKQEQLAALRDRYQRESKVAKAITGWNNIVFADGDPDASLMFIGEAPGEEEDIQGKPFVGRAGKKLNEMIRAMGLTREGVYIANVLKVRPPNNRTPTAEEAALDGPFLLEQIRIVAPRVIVTLGKPATHFILNETRAMGQLRGVWHEHAGIPVMPTYHPAFLLRQYTEENRQKVWSDLQQVVRKIESLAQ
ncbi:MAG: uracil-DNA glycosylase [Phycisphaerales bacterium]